MQVAANRLKQLRQISRRILQKNLRATGPRHDVIAKLRARGTQSCDLTGKVVHDEMDAVPAAGFGARANGASAAPPSWTVRSTMAAAIQALHLRTQVRSWTQR
jgi:hypothetical protein